MKNNLAIKIENLSKEYLIYKNNIKENNFRDFIVGSVKSLNNSSKKNKESFLALKDINLDIKKGEKIGLIGANGAGKSTLLKILSKITPPSTGKITMSGRIASLLEVGTGFHSELSGRENIYMSGSILGMTRKEIKKQFNKIVEFAGVENFLDTPVKRYSSGMQVRLGFAVAAHLSSEILLVDEVLAVGDADFQKKCLGKMDELSKGEGRTLIFVSHDMGAIEKLCDRSIYLKNGKIKKIDKTENVINYYLKDSDSEINKIKKNLIKFEDNTIKFKKVNLYQRNKILKSNYVKNGEDLKIKIEYEIKNDISDLRIYFDLNDSLDQILFRSFFDEVKKEKTLKKGDYVSTAIIPLNLLAAKNYKLKIRATIFNQRSLFDGKSIDISLNVVNTGLYNKNYPSDPCRGKLALSINWKTERVS